MSDLIPGSLYAFSNLARNSTNRVLFTDKVCMSRRNRPIMYSRFVHSENNCGGMFLCFMFFDARADQMRALGHFHGYP